MPLQDFLSAFLMGNQPYVSPQYEGPWPEDVERLRRQVEGGPTVPFAPGPLLEAFGVEQGGSIQPPQLTPLGEKILQGKRSEPETFKKSEPPPERAIAQEKIEALRAQQEAEKQTAQAKEAETKRMRDEAMKQSLDPYSWLGGKGGEDHAAKLEKLRRIRQQAGGTGGGTFSQQADSPELQARLKERDEWTAGQPLRNMEYLTTPEGSRRNPEVAARAAEVLSRMRSAKSEEQMVANQQRLIEAVKSSESGKVPFKLAGQLALSGINVPYELRGTSPDQVKGQLLEWQNSARKDIENSMMQGTPEFAVRYLTFVDSAMPELIRRLEEGADPDAIFEEARRIVLGGALESGTMAFLQQGQPQQQGQ